VEPSAQNGILNSLDTRASWTLGLHLTSGAIDVIGVSGNNLTVITSGSNVGAGNGRLARFSNNVVLASGSTYTVSFLVKQTDTHTIAGYYGNIVGIGDIGGGFDVSGLFSSGATYINANIINRVRRVERFGTDVFRCSETFTMAASGTLTTFALAPIVAVANGANSAVGTKIGFAAPQIELGSAPTSFIPTTTGAQTRNADVISVTGVAGLIGQTEGTIYVEVDVRNFGNVGMIASISNATSSNRLEIYKFTDGKIYFDRLSATQSALTSVGSTATYTAPTILKIAVGYRSGDTIMYINGVAATAQQTPTFTFATLTKANIGSSQSDGSILNDRIRAVSIYQTRLPNTTTDGSPSLQSITTL
jgi:hypothetical protein